MDIVRTYHIMLRQIEQVVGPERITRLRLLAWLLSGLLHSKSVSLSQIASKIPGAAKTPSKVRRLARFVANRHVRVRAWYEPTARALLAEAAATGQRLRLLIDTTKVGNGYRLLMVTLAYRRRSLPLAWVWVRGKKGHSGGSTQCALLRYVHTLVPPAAAVVVVGDSEFTPLHALLEEWGWCYALRQKGSHLLRLSEKHPWQRCDSLVQPGQRRWLPQVQLTRKHRHRTSFLAVWHQGHKEPWLIATNLPDARQTHQTYSRRMWIDEMFGDLKGHGFDLEATRLRHFQRLSRLTLAVALLYVWVVAFGSQTIKQGRRHLVDRTDRRDLSVFRIGFDMLVRLLINHQPISIRSVPYFY